MTQRNHRKAHRDASICLVFLGAELWQERKQLRILEEAERELAAVGSGTEGAFTAALLRLYKSITQQSKRNRIQTYMKDDAIAPALVFLSLHDQSSPFHRKTERRYSRAFGTKEADFDSCLAGFPTQLLTKPRTKRQSGSSTIRLKKQSKIRKKLKYSLPLTGLLVGH